MLVLTTQLYQDGRPLPRAAAGARAAPSGALTLTEEFDHALRRCVRVAHLRRPGPGDDVLPPIRDATVIWMAGNRMTLTGLETDPAQRALAQSWYVELPGEIFRAALLYEDGGRALPRHRAVTLQPEHQGALFLQEAYDPDLRRNVRRAHLRAAGADAVAPLRDAVVTWIGDKGLTVIGIEADPLTRKGVSQAWYAEIGAAEVAAPRASPIAIGDNRARSIS